MGLHESQSRMWENLVGRSRPFWQHFYPQLQEAAFRASSANVEPTSSTARSTRSQPSLIRVEADEATYNLHIILRFELEQEMLDGSSTLADLPEAWNARMTEYLGVNVPDDAHGVLQDIHWSGGAIGYFPTYYARQHHLRADLGSACARRSARPRQQFERGEFGELVRVAAREPAPARAQVHVEGDARATRRRSRSTPGRTCAI